MEQMSRAVFLDPDFLAPGPHGVLKCLELENLLKLHDEGEEPEPDPEPVSGEMIPGFSEVSFSPMGSNGF